MDWLNMHAEAIVAFGGALITFVSWNTSQGMRLKAAETKLKEHGEALATLRSQHDGVQSTLARELTTIREKLAHIEGYLTAKRQAPRKD